MAPRGLATAPAWDRGRLLASPFFASLAPALAALPADRFPSLDDLNRVARARPATSGGGAPIRFVAASAPRAADYELGIWHEGAVPTRPGNLHDLFNALVWLVFPRTKAVLNARHVQEISARAGERERGTARDVLTLFDEGGILVACADPSLAALLTGFRWRELFWERRCEVGRAMRFRVFGHAIHEKAVAPFRGITAKALIVPVSAAELAAPLEAELALLDARAAEHFAQPDALASTRSLAPLPVLGIPGWTPENADAAYYDDTGQFRPGRTRNTA
ncbi:MAG: DUF3025 domain-containing protein [Burkholderiales bacterium]|nr:DUF3025 domain-containing protein [Burkholderiales bacterium]